MIGDYAHHRVLGLSIRMKSGFWLNAVKNVGRNLIENAVTERKEKPYTSLYDFCKRMHGNELNRRAVECLIKAGAFDRLGNNRQHFLPWN